MNLINENKLRNIIKEVCKNENKKIITQINLLFKYLNKLNEEIRLKGG